MYWINEKGLLEGIRRIGIRLKMYMCIRSC